VPESLIDEMDEAEDRVQKSIEIAGRLIREMKDLCQGVHIMPIGWEKRVPAVLEAAGL
jgi:methylenetetrahydrofolate reductase (NADPH)